jgi:hypothetical protein
MKYIVNIFSTTIKERKRRGMAGGGMKYRVNRIQGSQERKQVRKTDK